LASGLVNHQVGDTFYFVAVCIGIAFSLVAKSNSLLSKASGGYRDHLTSYTSSDCTWFLSLGAVFSQAPRGGAWFAIFDSPLVFSFYGLLIASAVYSLPFVVQPIRDAFRKIDKDLLAVSRTMGASKGQIFRFVIFPLSKQGITTGCILGFAHTIGEFGVVLLIGGNIPGETRVLSIALYDLIETMQMELANQVAAGLLGFSFLVLLLVSYLQRR
jgi:ABC-type molybdate transport system permease subunit